MKPSGRILRAGFTLIELLIALAIMALLSLLGYRALSSLVDSEAQLAAEAQRWRTLDTVFARIEADVRAAVPRRVRGGAGSEPAWVGVVDAAGNAELRFARAGSEFAIEPAAAGQRIAYRMHEDRVEVLYWPHLDQPAQVAPSAYALADGVAAFRIGYLDAEGGWRDRWPAPGEPPVPRALRIEMRLANGDAIERWIALR
jgi:general secretion pathway protein J